MKHVHFFGCSLTAGDELADDEFFPWISNCLDFMDYYKRRKPYMSDSSLREKYTDACKALSYPALLSSDSIKTYNHGKLGASLRECVFLTMQMINSGTHVDQIFFQIPLSMRELIISDDTSGSIQLANISADNFQYTQYVRSKIMAFKPHQWAVEDLMDILMLIEYVKSKKILFYVIELYEELKFRKDSIPKHAKFLKDNINSSDSIICLRDLSLNNDRSIGGHYNQSAHHKIKERLLPLIQTAD